MDSRLSLGDIFDNHIDFPPWMETPCNPPANTYEIAQQAIDVYLLSKLPNGEIRGIGWWQSANGYTAIALCEVWSGLKQNYDLLNTALRDCERRTQGFINEFNDDTLWWSLCCLHVYSIDGDDWFLEKAKNIWHYVKDHAVCRKGQVQFRGHDMEGACYWTSKADREQINSITTALFAELGVRLALIEQNSNRSTHSLIESARCSLGWILHCRYRHEEAIVLDNILLKKQEARDWTFTYTTGVTIGVCALLYEVIREDEYLTLACRMAQKAMCRSSWVEENGVLTEHGAYGRGNHRPWENSDAVGFKAVLIRHLVTLSDVIDRTECIHSNVLQTAVLIKTFININSQSQQERNTNGRGQYGPWWNGPFEVPTSHSQMAALDVVVAAVAAQKTGNLLQRVAEG